MRHLGWLRLVVAAMVVGLAGAPAARAASVAATCDNDAGNLQAKLADAALADAADDVVTLSGTCTDSYMLPDDATAPGTLTLTGDPTDGPDGFATDAQTNGRALTGIDTGSVTIAHLRFTGRELPDGADGAAIGLFGFVSPTVENCLFTGNRVLSITDDDAFGGAVAVEQDDKETGPVVLRDNVFGGPGTGDPNHADFGGGAVALNMRGSLELADNRFTRNDAGAEGGGVWILHFGTTAMSRNVFDRNEAARVGGGALIRANADGALTSNTFTGNRVVGPAPPFAVTGGGLSLRAESFAGATYHTYTQLRNRFEGNSIEPPDQRGGGEAVANIDVVSTNDRFTSNDMAGSGGRGAGLSAFNGLAPQGGAPMVFLARNVAVAGNRLAAGSGGGVFADAFSVRVPPVSYRQLNGTVAGNRIGPLDGSAPGEGSGPGIAGGQRARLELRNSVVYGNVLAGVPEALEITGFGEPPVVTFTDACLRPGEFFPGEGNLCTDPLLASPGPGTADVHLSAGSPVLDAGSNALVPADLTFDYNPADPLAEPGEPRIASGTVDMGADERDQLADVRIDKLDTPDPVQAGTELRYTITLTNAGPDAAAATTVEDALPAGVALVSAAASRGTCTSGPTVSCALGTLPAGESITLTLVVRPPAPGTLTNTATVASATPDPTPGDRVATATTLVTAPQASPPPPPPRLAEKPPPAVVSFAQVIRLPSQRRCLSRRVIPIRIAKRALKGKVVRSVTVRLNRKRFRVFRGDRLRSTLVLRGLPKGRFRIDITVVFADATKVSGSRRYFTCRKKRKGRERIPI